MNPWFFFRAFFQQHEKQIQHGLKDFLLNSPAFRTFAVRTSQWATEAPKAFSQFAEGFATGASQRQNTTSTANKPALQDIKDKKGYFSNSTKRTSTSFSSTNAATRGTSTSYYHGLAEKLQAAAKPFVQKFSKDLSRVATRRVISAVLRKLPFK
ncbi:unnamed protein product [Amoebophrya sp. A120]|nr:unnamed protein product [Amoebophrya sp. A120]|eukprot:GSA120T00018279001.1